MNDINWLHAIHYYCDRLLELWPGKVALGTALAAILTALGIDHVLFGVLLASVMGEMLYSIPTSLEYFHKKTTYIMTGTLACAVCNIVLDVVFILNFGYIAAAYATMLSKFLLFLFHYLLSRKVDREPLFQWRYVAGSLVFLGCINLLTVTRVDDLLTRGVLFLAIGLAFLWGVWKNRNDLLTLLRAKQ